MNTTVFHICVFIKIFMRLVTYIEFFSSVILFVLSMNYT